MVNKASAPSYFGTLFGYLPIMGRLADMNGPFMMEGTKGGRVIAGVAALPNDLGPHLPKGIPVKGLDSRAYVWVSIEGADRRRYITVEKELPSQMVDNNSRLMDTFEYTTYRHKPSEKTWERRGALVRTVTRNAEPNEDETDMVEERWEGGIISDKTSVDVVHNEMRLKTNHGQVRFEGIANGSDRLEINGLQATYDGSDMGFKIKGALGPEGKPTEVFEVTRTCPNDPTVEPTVLRGSWKTSPDTQDPRAPGQEINLTFSRYDPNVNLKKYLG